MPVTPFTAVIPAGHETQPTTSARINGPTTPTTTSGRMQTPTSSRAICEMSHGSPAQQGSRPRRSGGSAITSSSKNTLSPTTTAESYTAATAPAPDMAEAWLRLRSGHARPEDVALLEHESAEARYYDIHPGATYEQAHAAANEVSNWQNQIPAPTYEDYSKPWSGLTQGGSRTVLDAAWGFGALFRWLRLMTDKTVKLGIDIEVRVAVVVIGHQKKPRGLLGLERHDDTKACTQVLVAQPLQRVRSGEAVGEGCASVRFEVAQEGDDLSFARPCADSSAAGQRAASGKSSLTCD